MTVGKIEIKPANTGAIIAYVIISIVFFGTGILCLVLLLGITPVGETQTIGELIVAFFATINFASSTLAEYWWVLLVIAVGLLIVGFLVGWFLLYLTSKLGHILVYAGVALYIVGAIVGVIMAIPFGGALFALIGLAPAVMLVIGMFTNINKFKRAGEFMKFTGQVVMAERGMLLAPVMIAFITVLNFLTMASIFVLLVFVLQPIVPWLGYVIGSLASLVQMIVYYGIFYIAEAINTTYAYEWYRKRDPDLKFCRKNVAGVFRPILTFGIVTAIVRWMQNMLRNAASNTKGNAAGVILAILARVVASVIGFIFKYLTYFTLPAIVVEGKNFKDGVKRSFDLLKKYYMDVLIRETGVQRGYNLLQWIAIFIYGILGVIGGFIYKMVDPSQTWTFAMLIFVIPAVIFASIPTFFIFRPMKTAYLTFVFAYAQDEEKSFRLPTRMPADLRGDMKEARKTMNKDKSIAAVVLRD
ncbi:MAG: hypothetical protein FK733_06305 [Asgard group archaeon]|nr:hypothetical protein [Asgard group archaeon]